MLACKDRRTASAATRRIGGLGWRSPAPFLLGPHGSLSGGESPLFNCATFAEPDEYGEWCWHPATSLVTRTNTLRDVKPAPELRLAPASAHSVYLDIREINTLH